MKKSFLRKYYDENNPVSERLTIDMKLFIRLLILAICSGIFVVLRLINNHGIFDDFNPLLSLTIYGVMLVFAFIPFIGFGLYLFSQISNGKLGRLFNRISFEKKRLIFTILDFIIVIPICICVAVFVYGHIFRIQMVSGPSMEPSFYNGERVISTYNIDDIKRGDVIICDIDKETFDEAEDVHIIKRIVGMPGDKIKWQNGLLYINGDDIYENYISKSTGKGFDGNFFYYQDGKKISCGDTIPEGYVFVLGDNRGDSKDSRDLGLIPVSKIRGIVVLKFTGLKPSIIKRGVLE